MVVEDLRALVGVEPAVHVARAAGLVNRHHFQDGGARVQTEAIDDVSAVRDDEHIRAPVHGQRRDQPLAKIVQSDAKGDEKRQGKTLGLAAPASDRH